ncbi:hypothetical protein [Parachlamydia sp. AcF125]|uniref:hypothetical protein n=1 Tax=Parachlamydia sp. AcF125 TaxID=2795736 RepID=UPI001BD8FF29|nr:hypothetical protein [Parachlamydia sp. AcF125]MBS4169065.1 hypothetical protein [Parachlamydia sp. AcF125]
MLPKNLKRIGIAALLLVAVLANGLFLIRENLQKDLSKVENAYQAGERATTLSERKKAFNQALEGYLQLEVTYHPLYGNGKLYYNLGNTYFQLSEYPLAILYYEKALNLLSDPVKAEENLRISRQKLEIESTPHRVNVFQSLVFFHKWPLPTRLQGLSLSLILITGCLSLFIWYPYPGIHSLCGCLATVALILLGSALYSRFFSSVDAIVTHPTFLFREAGAQYAKVREDPLIAGSKVEVLDFSKKGWIKIATSQGEVGYTQAIDMQLIEPYR